MKPAQKAKYTMGGGIYLRNLCNITNSHKVKVKHNK